MNGELNRLDLIELDSSDIQQLIKVLDVENKTTLSMSASGATGGASQRSPPVRRGRFATAVARVSQTSSPMRAIRTESVDSPPRAALEQR